MLDFFLIVLIFIISITLLEIIVRQLYIVEISRSCYQEDTVFFYKPKPNCQSTNKGFEGKVYTHIFNDCGYISKHQCKEKTVGTLRIVGLGDSFTEGTMVNGDETYLAVLERILQQKMPNNKVEMFNLGVNGYDLIQYFQRITEALQLKPDILTVGILPNDFFAPLSLKAINEQQNALRKLGPRMAVTKRYESIISFRENLRYYVQQSRLFSVLLHYAYLNRKIYTMIFFQRGLDLGYVSTTFSPYWDNQMIEGEILISKMAQQAKQNGSIFVIVHIPQRIQAALLGVTYDNKLIDPFIFGNRLKEICNRHDIYFIDFMEILKRTANPERLYYPVDGHLTPEGQSLLGRFVANRMLEKKLWPLGN